MYRPHIQDRHRNDADDAERINRFVTERFTAQSHGYAEVGDEQATEVGQQGLQPTPQDLKLWLVECKTGSEREAVISLMQKCIDLASKGTPLAIKAVFTQDHLKVGLIVPVPIKYSEVCSLFQSTSLSLHHLHLYVRSCTMQAGSSRSMLIA